MGSGLGKGTGIQRVINYRQSFRKEEENVFERRKRIDSRVGMESVRLYSAFSRRG